MAKVIEDEVSVFSIIPLGVIIEWLSTKTNVLSTDGGDITSTPKTFRPPKLVDIPNNQNWYIDKIHINIK